MSGLRLMGALVAAAALLPGSASAFSFLSGGFPSGQYIDSISISAAGGAFEYDSGADPYDFGDDTVSVSFSVSEVKMTDGTTYTVPLETVLVSMVLGVDVVTLTTQDFSATLTKEVPVDLMIVDLLDAGNVLLEADFTGAEFGVSENILSVISGSLSGDFGVVGGDPNFTGAFGSPGHLGPITLTELATGGGTVTNLCTDLTTPYGLCFPGYDYIVSFSAQPNGTLTATPIPEPGTLAAVALGLVALAALRRRS